MFLDFLEKREETTDSITLTDEEKIFLKVFGIDSEQPAAAMREATYFTCIKQLSEAVAKTPLYLVQDTENGIRRATEERLNELLSLRPNPYMTATGYVYLQSQEDKNGRNLDLVKTVNGKDYFQNRQLITLSDEAVTASATGKVVFYVVNLYALVKFFERKGYTVSTDKSVFFESDETALKVQERFDCEKLDDRADFKVEFTPAA